MKKILPFDPNTTVHSYHITAFYLGVLKANNISIDGILCNHFSTLSYWKGNVDYIENTYAKYRAFELQNIENIEINCSNLKKILNSGYYAVIVLNQKFIKGSHFYNFKDDYHDFLLYGYDDEKQQFLFAGYVGSVFSKFEVDYDKLVTYVEKALDNFRGYIEMRNHIFKINSNYKEEKINIDLIQHNLKFNLKITGTLARLRLLLINHIISCLVIKKYDILDVITYRIVFEHYLVMMRIFNTLLLSEEDLKKYCDLYKNMESLPYLVVKEQLKHSKSNLYKIFSILYKMIKIETKCTRKILRNS